MPNGVDRRSQRSMMEKRGTPLSIGAFQGGRGAVRPPESTDTGDNEVLHKADDGRRGAECEKQIRREKRNRGEEGKMTEQTEQMDLRVRCLPDGEKTLAPKEYRVRWLSRLQLPLIGFCQGVLVLSPSAVQAGRAKERGHSMVKG
jgi:hypothetical protein